MICFWVVWYRGWKGTEGSNHNFRDDRIEVQSTYANGFKSCYRELSARDVHEWRISNNSSSTRISSSLYTCNSSVRGISCWSIQPVGGLNHGTCCNLTLAAAYLVSWIESSRCTYTIHRPTIRSTRSIGQDSGHWS